jgi:D-arabinose 1-dehydrogenase-like Zn-dependent alcohol dehydrogenase
VKAVVFDQFGPAEVLQFRDVPDPIAGAGEVLVRVRACSVNRTVDIETREKGAGFGVALPHVSGADPCGEVVAVGSGVTSPHVGQRVAVSPMLTCGACPMCRRGTENACLNLKLVGVHRHGGYAELVRAPVVSQFDSGATKPRLVGHAILPLWRCRYEGGLEWRPIKT